MICSVCGDKRKEFEEKEKFFDKCEKEDSIFGIYDVHHYLKFGETEICFYCIEDLLKFLIEQYLSREASD